MGRQLRQPREALRADGPGVREMGRVSGAIVEARVWPGSVGQREAADCLELPEPLSAPHVPPEEIAKGRSQTVSVSLKLRRVGLRKQSQRGVSTESVCPAGGNSLQPSPFHRLIIHKTAMSQRISEHLGRVGHKVLESDAEHTIRLDRRQGI